VFLYYIKKGIKVKVENIKLDEASRSMVKSLLDHSPTTLKNKVSLNLNNYLSSGSRYFSRAMVRNNDIIRCAAFSTLNVNSAETFFITNNVMFSQELLDTLCLACSSHTPTITRHTCYTNVSEQAFKTCWFTSRLGRYTTDFKYSLITSEYALVEIMVKYE
jgi:hypothetical protein